MAKRFEITGNNLLSSTVHDIKAKIFGPRGEVAYEGTVAELCGFVCYATKELGQWDPTKKKPFDFFSQLRVAELRHKNDGTTDVRLESMDNPDVLSIVVSVVTEKLKNYNLGDNDG